MFSLAIQTFAKKKGPQSNVRLLTIIHNHFDQWINVQVSNFNYYHFYYMETDCPAMTVTLSIGWQIVRSKYCVFTVYTSFCILDSSYLFNIIITILFQRVSLVSLFHQFENQQKWIPTTLNFFGFE